MSQGITYETPIDGTNISVVINDNSVILTWPHAFLESITLAMTHQQLTQLITAFGTQRRCAAMCVKKSPQQIGV